jgi:hypothetical protein
MTYYQYKPELYYLAAIDLAHGTRKEASFFQVQSDYQRYQEFYSERRMNYGQLLLLDLRSDARQILDYEAGSKPFFSSYKLGMAVASCEVECPSDEVVNSYSAAEKQIYYLGLRRVSNLRCYPEHFSSYLSEAAQAQAIRASTLD